MRGQTNNNRLRVRCGELVLDLNKTKMDNEEVSEYVSTERQCPSCEHKGFLIRSDECSDCKNPTPSSVFDQVLHIKKQGERQSSSIQIVKWYPYEELEEKPDQEAQPLNFPKIFVPDSFEEQARKLKIDNPWHDEKEERREEYRNYDRSSRETNSRKVYDDDIPF
jgi:hypothetical protein